MQNPIYGLASGGHAMPASACSRPTPALSSPSLSRACAALVVALSLAIGVPGAFAAPAQRSYEMVSPLEKNGVDVMRVLQVSDDGSAAAWSSIGAYADPVGFNASGPYVARRGTDGRWSTKSMWPRLTDTSRVGATWTGGGYAFSEDFRRMTMITRSAVVAEDTDSQPIGLPGNTDVYLIDEDRTPTWISRAVDGPPPNLPVAASVAGISRDGSSVFFRTAEPLSSEVVGGTHLYRWRGGVTELVGRGLDGLPLPNGSVLGGGLTSAVAGGGDGGTLKDSVAISADGRTFAYESGPGGTGTITAARQVYLSVADGPIVRVSSSQRAGNVGEPAPTGATFVTASSDLGTVYVRSSSQLTDDAPVGGGDYSYDVATGTLTFSNPDEALGIPNGPRGFVRASEDGAYVYFAAFAALAPGAGAEPSLYVRGPGGIKLVSEVGASDETLTVRRRTTPPFTATVLSRDGTKLLFQSKGRVTGYDNAGTKQVYLYDALSESVTCISCNPRASSSQGDAFIENTSGWTTPTPRAMSADGSRIAFVSTEALVAEDTNGVEDVYEYADGELSLVTSGTSIARSDLAGMTADGSQIFFVTRSSLVAADIDGGLRDMYVARHGIDDGTDRPAAECVGDGCQDAPGQGPTAPATGSAALQGPGNAIAPLPLVTRLRVTRPRVAVGVSATLRIRVPAAGRLRVAGAGLRTTTRAVGPAATVRVPVALSRSARRALAYRKRLEVRVRVVLTTMSGRLISERVTLRFRRAGKAGGR